MLINENISVSRVWLFIYETLGIANFANTKKVNLFWPCITHGWSSLKVLNLDSMIIGKNFESQTPLKIPIVPVILKNYEYGPVHSLGTD